VHPSGTGYVRGLYTVPRNDPRVSEFIEREFLKVTDNEAARVLQSLKRGGEIIWAVETRSAWSRFILSLMLRNPEYVRRVAAEVAGFFDPSSTELNDRYRAIRKAGDPETYAEYIALTGHPAGRTSAVAMQTIIDSPRMGGQLNRMRWSVIGFRNERHPLLTSDRPIIMTNGMVKPESHLALPIGPRMLFLATNTLEMEREIRSMARASSWSTSTIVWCPRRESTCGESTTSSCSSSRTGWGEWSGQVPWIRSFRRDHRAQQLQHFRAGNDPWRVVGRRR
jgi:Protein of unknown function (DUF4238)